MYIYICTHRCLFYCIPHHSFRVISFFRVTKAVGGTGGFQICGVLHSVQGLFLCLAEECWDDCLVGRWLQMYLKDFNIEDMLTGGKPSKVCCLVCCRSIVPPCKFEKTNTHTHRHRHTHTRTSTIFFCGLHEPQECDVILTIGVAKKNMMV